MRARAAPMSVGRGLRHDALIQQVEEGAHVLAQRIVFDQEEDFPRPIKC